jgi:hypothetical protein
VLVGRGSCGCFKFQTAGFADASVSGFRVVYGE